MEQPFKPSKNKVIIATIMGSRFVPQNIEMTRIFLQVLDENSQMLSQLETAIPSYNSNLSHPDYFLSVQIPANNLKKSQTAYITVTVVGSIAGAEDDPEDDSENEEQDQDGQAAPTTDMKANKCIVAFCSFNLFCSEDKKPWIVSAESQGSKYLREGLYQVPMFHPSYIKESLIYTCQIIDNSLIDHIPAYSTLLHVKQLQSKNLEHLSNQLISDFKDYSEGVYNNQAVQLYPREVEVMKRISEKPRHAFVDVIEALEEAGIISEPPVEDNYEIYEEWIMKALAPGPRTLIIDDTAMYEFLPKRGFNVSIDLLYKVSNYGLYTVCLHYVTDQEINFLDIFIANSYNWDSPVSCIEFTSGYFEIDQNEIEASSEIQVLMFTVLEIVREEDGEGFSLSPHGFAFMPLVNRKDHFLQGSFQIPIFVKNLNSEILDLIQAVDSWTLLQILQGKLPGGPQKGLSISGASLVVRVRMKEFDGWKEDQTDLYCVNTMFMPDNFDENNLLNMEKYDKFLDELPEDFPTLEDYRDFAQANDDLEAFVFGYFQDIQNMRQDDEYGDINEPFGDEEEDNDVIPEEEEGEDGDAEYEDQ